jgi:acyl dehydratase
VLDERPSKSLPGAGMVSVKTTGCKQKGVIVREFIRSMLVKRGENAIATKANY